jgi:hypothetical protein
MADLIIGIVGDILGHIAVKDLKGSDVGSTDRTGCTDSAQFVILLPQIGFDKFGCSRESQNRDIPPL